MMLSIQQAAERLNVADYTIRKAVERGNLKAYRIGQKLLRIDEGDLNQYVQQSVFDPPFKASHEREGRRHIRYKPGMKII